MKVIVVSPFKTTENEISVVCKLFENGLQTFHLRKPKMKLGEMMNYIKQIPEKYHNRIVLHSNHKLALTFNLAGIHYTSKVNVNHWKTRLQRRRLIKRNPYLTISTSFHKTLSLEVHNNLFDYVFLSPIFDSITKKDYQSAFNEFVLQKALSQTKYNVIALGGVDQSKIEEIKTLNFSGAALLGSIWESNHPLESFNSFVVNAKANH